MMRSGLVAAIVVGLALVVPAVAHAQAKTMTAVGSVAKIEKDMIDLDTGKTHLMLVTNEKTMVKVAGGGAQAQRAREEGAKGLKVTEAVHEGDQISAKYMETGGKMVVSEINVLERRPASAQKVK